MELMDQESDSPSSVFRTREIISSNIQFRQLKNIFPFLFIFFSSPVAVSKEELVMSLRRHSKGFSRGTSKYRGVTKHQKVRHDCGIVRNQTQSNRVLSSKYSNRNTCPEASLRSGPRVWFRHRCQARFLCQRLPLLLQLCCIVLQFQCLRAFYFVQVIARNPSKAKSRKSNVGSRK